MKRTLIGMLAGGALIATHVMASAQDAKIMDGNNPAPTYSPSSTGPTPQTGTAKIMDGNNPAPNYAGNPVAKPVKSAHKAAGAQHATYHKAHAHTS